MGVSFFGKNGKATVDPCRRTPNPRVRNVGDLAAARALAHEASEKEVVAAEGAAGAGTHPLLPLGPGAGATFVQPQAASPL